MKNTKCSTVTSATKLQVSITYTWTFSAKEWKEQEEHMEALEEDINQKLSYDPISTFHHLNNIIQPNASYRVKSTK